MSLRFGSDVRLRSRREYLAVQQGGRRISTRFLTMLVLPNTLGRDRLGVVASKKIGGAVIRNRAKRRLRELFRHHDPARSASAQRRRGLDLVVIAKREVTRADSDQLRADFGAALGRVGARARA